MRLRRSFSRRGLLGTVRLAAWHAAEPVRAVGLAVRERRFEARYGVETGGNLKPWGGSLYGDAVGYAPTQPDRFDTFMALLPCDPGSLTFVDLGCGKGKALVLAAEAGFARAVGVEFDPELAAVARRNLAARGLTGDIVELDAARFTFPDQPLFVYLFNPFGEQTLTAVLDALRRSYADRRRPMFLAYDNAVHRERVRREEFLSVLGEGTHWILLGAT